LNNHKLDLSNTIIAHE
jgi:hypothetical protein